MAHSSDGTLRILRARMLAADLRSRSIRLTRCTKSGAFDLARLHSLAPKQMKSVLRQFGRDENPMVPLVPTHNSLAPLREAAADLSTLSRAAHARWLETGAQELSLGWPLVEARGPEGTWVRAPLLLTSLTLERDPKNPRLLTRVTSLPDVNEPFTKVLSRIFGISLDLNDVIDGDTDGLLRIDTSTFVELAATLRERGFPLRTDAVAPPALGDLAPISTRDKAARNAINIDSITISHAAVIGRFPRSGSQLVSDYDVMLSLQDSTDLGLCRALLDIELPDGEAPPEVDTRPDDDVPKADAPSSFLRENESPDDDDDGGLGLRRWQVLPSDESQDAVLRALFVDDDVLSASASASAPASTRSDLPMSSDVPSLDHAGLVVQGPPGTGKSQLLANVLAAAIGANKTALVVCQKRAALDVVAQRLTSVGLGDACVVVHDTTRDRTDVARAISSRLAPLLDDHPQDDDRALSVHAAHAEKFGARLAKSQQAFLRLTQAKSGRPPLLSLLEDDIISIDDDSEPPLPDLSARVSDIGEVDLDAAIPRAELLESRARPLAAPHGLHWRRSFAGLSSDNVTALFLRMQHAAKAVDAFGSAEEAVTNNDDETVNDNEDANETTASAIPFAALSECLPAFEAAHDALRTLAVDAPADLARAGHHLRLFWAWCEGSDDDGEWNRVRTALGNARATLPEIPRELVTATSDAVTQWKLALEQGAVVESRWARLLSPTHWRSRGAIAAVAAATHADPMSRADTLTSVNGAIAWHALIASMPDNNRFLEIGLTGSLDDLDDAIAALSREFERVGAIHDLARALAGTAASSTFFTDLTPDLGRVHDAWTKRALAAHRRVLLFQKLGAALEEMADDVDAIDLDLYRQDLRQGKVAKLRFALNSFVDAKQDASEAQQLDRELANDPPFLATFMRRYRSPLPDDAARIGSDLTRAVRRGWRTLVLDGDDEELLCAPLIDPRSLERLRTAADTCQNLAPAAAVAALRKRVRARALSPSPGRQLRRLLAQCQKKRRRPSLRTLTLAAQTSGLTTLIPVWLCSPDAVAHLFDAKAGVFDLVIFDEASQCPVEAGLPALWRGKRALIAGDDQQMPPSHFFASKDDDEELDDDDDVVQSQSLLALSRVVFPSRSLSYHYRSRDERLIAFSNAAFYGGKLTTAPMHADAPHSVHDVRHTLHHTDNTAHSAAAKTLGFRWCPVGGTWHNQQNAVEAEAVVDEITRILDVPSPPTVGVVCMNRPQADLVEVRLEARAISDLNFDRLLKRDAERAPIEQLFVRNLENVQGDERDVILYSIGYGRTADGGPVRARLGPLAQAGGEKRLNVAITRAKRQIVVVTSFAPEELDVTKAKHAGPKLFRLWLQYARLCARGDNTAAVLATAAALMGPLSSSISLPPSPSHLGSRLFAHMAPVLDHSDVGWQTRVGLGLEKMDFVRGHQALDVTSMWRQPDAIARDVTGPAFWQRAGFHILRVTPQIWRQHCDAWTAPSTLRNEARE